MATIEGKIAAILSRTEVIVNRGLAHGVSKGDKFYVEAEIGPVYDPETNEDLGKLTRVWGKVEVTRIAEKFCMARTEYVLDPDPMSRLASLAAASLHVGPTGHYENLPVAQDDISELVTRVRRGSRVFMNKPSAVDTSGPPAKEADQAPKQGATGEHEEPADVEDPSP